MAEFNITGSKIDQLNNSGNNVKITGNEGTVAVTGNQGQSNQAVGDGNTQATSEKDEGPLTRLWAWIKKSLGIGG